MCKHELHTGAQLALRGLVQGGTEKLATAKVPAAIEPPLACCHCLHQWHVVALLAELNNLEIWPIDTRGRCLP